MWKRVIVPGLLGAAVCTIVTIVSNVVFGFTGRIAMKEVADERTVYEVLKANITEPGVYLVNPPLTPEGRFPDGAPVYGILYSGVGHESAGAGELLWLAIAIGSALAVTWLLSLTSERFLARYGSRVLFFFVVGCLLAVSGDLGRFGIGGYPLPAALAFAARTVLAWTLAGMVVAWRMPGRHESVPG